MMVYQLLITNRNNSWDLLFLTNCKTRHSINVKKYFETYFSFSNDLSTYKILIIIHVMFAKDKDNDEKQINKTLRIDKTKFKIKAIF